MNGEQIFTAANTMYIMGLLLAIGVLLAYIASKLSEKSHHSKKR